MTESIYRVTEVIGTSTESWEDAARHAVETAAQSLRDLRVGEIVKLDVTIEDGRVTHLPGAREHLVQVRQGVTHRPGTAFRTA